MGEWQKLKPAGGGLWFSPVESLIIPNHGSLAIRRFPKAGGAEVEALSQGVPGSDLVALWFLHFHKTLFFFTF